MIGIRPFSPRTFGLLSTRKTVYRSSGLTPTNPKGNRFWDCQPAVDSSWYLKRLCRVRDLFSSDTGRVGQMFVVRLNAQVKQVTSGGKGMAGKFSERRSFDNVVTQHSQVCLFKLAYSS
uniref:Uncharacterized protein n=1 Tax=Opuntia streptacantha TaxID=393608 RepID=A0A7C9DPP9_OPUST